MSGDELPAPLPPNENICEPALAGDRCAFDDSFGGYTTGDDSRLVIEHHSHFIHIVSDQFYIRIRGLLEAFQVLFPRGESAAGIGEDELFGFDAIKES